MTTFDIRQIDAWGNQEAGYIWNDSIKIGQFSTSAKDEKRPFLRTLKNLGITFKRGTIKVVYEVQDRKTGKPLFAAIPA